MSDATAFLWRSELAGHPRDAAAWRAMYEYANSALPRPGSGLADLHVILAQAVMGDDAALDVRARQMEDLAREGRYPSGSYLPTLSRGFAAFERGDFPAAIEVLAPLAGESERIGGSRAQHDLIEFTLLKAYLEADRLEEARHLLQRAATWRFRRSRRGGCGGALTCGAGSCLALSRVADIVAASSSCRAPNNNRKAGLSHEDHEAGAVAGEGGRYVLGRILLRGGTHR